MASAAADLCHVGSYVGVDDSKMSATVAGLEQGYVVCPADKRFLLLFTFLKKNMKKKKVNCLVVRL